MIILNLNLEGFKKFKTKKFTFAPGLNCLFGDNESGKTTILNAINAIFFGMNYEDCKSWSQDDLCIASLQYQIDHHRKFTLQRDFLRSECQLTTDTGTIINSPRQIKDIVTNHLGFSERNFFEDTVFVKQAQLTQLKLLERSANMIYLIPGLNKLIKAQKAIQLEMDELDNTHPNVKNRRTLQTKMDLLAEKEHIFEERKQTLREFSNLSKLHEEQFDLEKNLQSKLEQYENTLASAQKRREITLRTNTLNDELGQVNGIYEYLSSAEKKRTEIAKELSSLAQFDFPSDFDVKADFLIGQSYGLEEETSVHAKIGGGSNTALIEIFLWLLSLTLIGTGMFIGNNYLVLIALLIIAIWVVMFLKRSFMLGAQQQKASFEKDRTLFIEQLKELSKVFIDVDEQDPNFIEIRSQLQDYQLKFRRFQALKQEDNEARIRLEQTIMQIPHHWEINPNSSDIVNILKEKKHSVEEDLANINLPENDSSHDENQIDEVEINKLIDEIKNRLPDVLNHRISYENQLKLSTQQIEKWDDVENEIIRLKEEISDIQQRIQILKKADLGFQKAINELTSVPRLNQLTSNYFSAITSQKYQICQINNDDNRLLIQIEIPEHKKFVTTDQGLSYGTVEQFYLALRLALIEKYPSALFLDDIFVHFDRKRQKSTLDLLNRLAKQRQIFVTSHDPVITKMLEKVAHLVNLDE